MKKEIIFCGLLFYTILSFAQVSVNYDSILQVDRTRLVQHVNILASDEFEGRGTGQVGQKRAANYIRQNFSRFGLESITADKEPYFQPFNVGGKDRVDEKISIFYDRSKKISKRDFYTEGYFTIPELESEVIWVGYGIDDEKYSDYEGIDVKDKVVVAMLGEPKDKTDNNILTGSKAQSDWSMAYYKIAKAKEKGASSIILVHHSEHDFIRYKNRAKILPKVKRNDALQRGVRPPSFGTFFINPKILYKLLGLSKSKNKVILESFEKNPSIAKRYKKPIRIRATRQITRTITENVIGFLPGTDLKEEVIILAAHYDHLGKKRDEVYNGADDNCSGVSILLEIAEKMAAAKANGWQNKRSILFIAFSGEEKGLLGSLHYTRNPVFDLEATHAVINLDMVGRATLTKRKKWRTYIICSVGLHKRTKKNVAANSPKIKLNYNYNSKNHPEQFYYRSDHYNFAKYGIPFLYFTTGIHDDYHQPTDDAHRINYDGLQAIGQMVLHLTKDLVNTSKKP